MKNSYLANRIKALRTAKGYSQELLAEKTNLSLRTIQRIESGQTEPHGDTLQRLAASLDVEVADFMESEPVKDLPENRSYLVLIHLSALSFIIFPLLGVLLPFILWTVKCNEVKDIAQTSKRVLNFQITWCILYFLIFAFILGNVFFNFNIELPVHFSLSPKLLLLFFPAFYGYNIIMMAINAILESKGKRLLYIPVVRLFR